MGLTRIDLDLQGAADGSFVCLNPGCRPGSLLFVGSRSSQGQLGEQVARKLAVEHFVDGVLHRMESSLSEGTPVDRLANELLESGFKKSNASVYEFSHRLAAGGRFRAAVSALCVFESNAAAGRVGDGSAYLIREGKVFPFFSDRGPTDPSLSFVGKDSVVDVELVTLPLQPDDVLLVFDRTLEAESESVLIGLAPALSDLGARKALRLVADKIPSDLVLALRVGPDAFYLSEEVV